MFKLLYVAIVSFLIVGCQSTKSEKEKSTSLLAGYSEKLEVPDPNADGIIESQGTPEWAWTYSGDKGPQAWGALNPEFALCASGQAQSPIDLRWKAPTGKKTLQLNYLESRVTVSNSGYAYRLDFDPQSTMNFAGQDYVLEKAELRTPSEHRLSGKQVAGELQLYHRSTNGLRRAIVSLLIVQGKPSQWFQKFIDVAKTTALYRTGGPVKMNPAKMIPPRRTFYHYQGSLTHPPCVEGVEWLVFNTPLQMSAEQLVTLQSQYKGNNRPVQPLNGRSVTNYK